MSQSVVLRGADIRVYVGGKLYPCQQIIYTIDYGETEIYGVDSPYPQEIAPGRITTQGSIHGLRIKLTGGLQGYGLRTKINQVLYGPYVSLRIKDRHSNYDILWLPQMKVANEQFQGAIKGIVRLSFNFKGVVPYSTLDMN